MANQNQNKRAPKNNKPKLSKKEKKAKKAAKAAKKENAAGIVVVSPTKK